MNPVKKVKHSIRDRKRKKRWKKMKRHVGRFTLDVWNIASHSQVLVPDENTVIPELVPQSGFTMVIDLGP